ncbi:MAG: OmpH family outer membrane protein [Pseudomonadota bacterium]
MEIKYMPAALFAVAIMVSAPALVIAQAKTLDTEVKIGIVDLQQAISTVKDGQMAKKKLKAFKKKKEKILEGKADKIKAMEAELEKQLPLMTEKAKQEKLKEYQKEMMEAQNLYVEIQSELAKKQQELFEPILQRLGGLIEELALEFGYSLIMDKSGGAVLYYSPQTDLTPELIKRFNAAK